MDFKKSKLTAAAVAHSAPRLVTREVKLCAIISLLSVVQMVACVVHLSRTGTDWFPLYRDKLTASWINKSIPVDNFDRQYALFRGSLSILIPVMLAHLAISNILQAYFQPPRLEFARKSWSIAFSAAFFIIFYGCSGLFKIVIVLIGNFVIAKSSGSSKFTPTLAWMYAGFVLITTHYWMGFEFGWISPQLHFLDGFSGMSDGWHESMRFCFLRMVSFDMDYFWMMSTKPNHSNNEYAKEVHGFDCRKCLQEFPCPKARSSIARPREDYNLFSYLVYALYVPLYFAGPIISFNDFSYQMSSRMQETQKTKTIGTYALRLLFAIALMEVFMHFVFVIAIGNSPIVWKEAHFSLFQVACIGFFNLKHIWLKLLIIWRFFRLWAYADGIVTVENMNKCMSNNYSAIEFWRCWHRSFNRWIVRYIYAPLGGRRFYLINVIISLLFVALWHDLDVRLLIWGVFVTLSIIPEFIALRLFPAEKWESWVHYKRLCGAAAVLNILLMITVNIIGFGAAKGSSSIDMKDIMAFVLRFQNVPTFLGIILFLYTSSQKSDEMKSPHTNKPTYEQLAVEDPPSGADAASFSRTRTTMFTTELIVHGAFMLAWMATMILSVARASQRLEAELSARLSHSWLEQWFGVEALVDDSDLQFRGFRESIYKLAAFAAVECSATLLVERTVKSYVVLVAVKQLASMAFLAFFVGPAGLMKLIIVVIPNYLFVKFSGGKSKFVPVFAWVYGLAILFATNYYQGFLFSSVSSHLGFLDDLGHGISKWWLPLRFVLLKMISFDMDRYWLTPRDQSQASVKYPNICTTFLTRPFSRISVEKHVEFCRECRAGGKFEPNCAKARIELSHAAVDYNFVAYLTYILYVPLFIAGPIITYNDFVAQLKSRPPNTLSIWFLVKYALRWVACYLLMEVFIHNLYVIAMAQTLSWKSFSAFEIISLCFFNLKHIWLKLLLMWRFFRLWALCDGVETVENMNRCMTNNYSASGFWRSWHCSFNRWIIRYIYVPLGGKNCYVINLVLTFLFVAVWHDLDFNLLAWGLLISMTFIPENLAGRMFPKKKWEHRYYYKHLCGLGAVANILLMIAVNLIGYGAMGGSGGGLRGVLDTLPLVFNSNSLWTWIGTVAFFFSLSQCQFAYREWESNHGIIARD